MLDHITISFEADDDVKAAVLGAVEHIKEETLADSVVEAEGLEKFDINGHKTGLAVAKC